MIRYIRGSETAFESLYQAFKDGFSDYIIKMEISQEMFKDRFFGPEGNEAGLSYVAFDGDMPVGVVLSGIRQWDGMKTMRCGTLCVSPGYRGTGISEKLMEMHMAAAKENGCDRLSLEVIKGNDRAIRFYEKLGYFPAYDLKYFKLKKETALEKMASLEQNPHIKDLTLSPADVEAISQARQRIPEVHIHWQAEVDYYKDSPTDKHFELTLGGERAGYLSVTAMGKVNFLWIEPKHRKKGLAKAALVQYLTDSDLPALSFGFINNGLLEGFVRAVGADKDPLEQFEMYKHLV